MPKKVIVTTIWSCSLCEGNTDEEKVTPFTVKGAGRTLTYDVCATCVASEPFASFLAAGLSERAAGKAKIEGDDAKTPCPYCGKKYTETGMGMHQASAHNVKSKTQITMERRGKVGKYVCEECDFRSNAPQGLAAHRVARHGINGTSENAVKHAKAVAANLATTGHPCPDCPEFTAASAQGLGAHRRHVHPGEPKLGHGGGHRTRKTAAAK